MNVVVQRRLRRRLEDHPSAVRAWIPLLLGFATICAVGLTVAIGTAFAAFTSLTSGYVPIDQKITERFAGLTQIYDRGGPDGGVYLGSISNPEAQLLNPIPLDQISPFLVEATISTEDNSFWTNPGIDPKALVRATWENYTGGFGSGTGGSSITQQLVKNVYLTDQCSIVEGQRECIAPRTVGRKLKEIAYSFELQQEISKSQILNLYLNQISYADRYVGVQAAAEGYFHKAAIDLTLGESTLLAGIPAAPTLYHPRLNCVRDDAGTCVTDDLGRTTVGGTAKERQRHVLDLMVEHGRTTQAEADAAFAEPLLIYPPASTVQASAWIDNQIEPRLTRMCEAGILPRTPGATDCAESVRNGGYRVTTTLDWAETQKATVMMQRQIAAGLAANCACHNAAVTTIDPSTGQVVVYAPNIDPTWVSDPRVSGNIDQLNEINQPGSSFKPAVYLAYMDKLQKVPLSSLWDTSPLEFTDPGSREKVSIVNPRQNGTSEGLITVRAALGGSQNVPAFRAASEVGPDAVIAYAKALGLTTLDQHFDPTFRSHDSISYGAAIATGGANVRAIDMAYMNSVFANMGYMVGVPSLAKTVPLHQMKSIAGAFGAKLEEAQQQALDFRRGNIRIPGTRTIDPVVVLRVESIDGKLLYQEGEDLQRIQVVDPGSVWLLQSIMTDCTARFIIWTCGSSNDDLNLDAFVDGVKIPMGIKTGTQQGFTDSADTLATWMNGFSRYAATAVWVGNADKSLVRDGRPGNYASANATIRLFKNWMGQYHHDLKEAGAFTTPENFDALKPANVAKVQYQTATTERGRGGGCRQMIEGWVRTDVPHLGDCQGKGFMQLPALRPDLAAGIAVARGIPTNGGVRPVFQGGDAAPPTPTPSASATSSPPAGQPSPPPSRTPSPPTPALTPVTPVPGTPRPRSATPPPAAATPAAGTPANQQVVPTAAASGSPGNGGPTPGGGNGNGSGGGSGQ